MSTPLVGKSGTNGGIMPQVYEAVQRVQAAGACRSGAAALYTSSVVTSSADPRTTTGQERCAAPPPRPRVGMVGAGQLARMTYQAAISLGLTLRVLAARAGDCAARIGADVELGDPDSFERLSAFAAGCDVLTFDHELVDPQQLAALEAAGHRLYPSAATVALAQNKRRQRATFGAAGLPVPPNQVVMSPDDLLRFAAARGWPVVAKAARGGYDGRGVWVLEDAAAAERLWQETSRRGVELLVEQWVPIERELAVLVARRPGGEQVVYPVVETVQVEGICREVVAPAPVSPALAAEAQRIARRVAELSGVTGILAVELFLAEGRLLVNEIATRPHNSGHYSIEGCYTSQFENHLRAILDWPLGNPALVAPCVVMVNVLGRSTEDLHPNLPAALAVDGVRLHLYDKEPRPGRKLGHVTALGADPDETRARAREAAERLAGGA